MDPDPMQCDSQYSRLKQRTYRGSQAWFCYLEQDDGRNEVCPEVLGGRGRAGEIHTVRLPPLSRLLEPHLIIWKDAKQ